MELQTFTVPVPVDRAWDALLGPQRIAPCMPGASFESVEGDAFTGNVKIKLGPINLSYRGQARCVTNTADLCDRYRPIFLRTRSPVCDRLRAWDSSRVLVSPRTCRCIGAARRRDLMVTEDREMAKESV
jgi:hypothetical protein